MKANTKVTICTSLFIAMLFSVATAVNAGQQSMVESFSFKVDASCAQKERSSALSDQTCAMTIESLERQNKILDDENYAESSAVEGIASPVSEPTTTALMLLGFGILSMVAGARMKNS